MSNHQENNDDYMDDEQEMEDVDDDMGDQFHGRDAGASDSDADEYDYMVCSKPICVSSIVCVCNALSK